MTANWEKKEGNTGVLSIEVSSERFDTALDEAFKKVVKQVDVPGFRKGRVPRQIFEQRFGVESLYQDAIDLVLPEAYTEAVTEAGIEPVAQPEIDIEHVEKGDALKFTATVTVKPEVELGEYKGLEVEVAPTEVTDEEVDQEIEATREKHADLVAIEDGEVANGDTVVMDFEGFVDGEAFEGGQAENYSLEIGSGQFIPGFEDQLIGAKPGSDLEVNVEFPEEYHSEELAGKAAMFKVKLHDVKRKDLPELDDEFAKDVNESFESFEDLKKDIRANLEKTKGEESEMAKKDSLVEQATENANIDVPSAMVETEKDRMLEEFSQRLQSQGMTMDMYYQFAQTDEEGMKAQFEGDAEKRVRMNLTLEAIAEKEEIEVSDEAVDEEIEKMAEMYGRSADEIKQILMMQGGTDQLKSDLRIRKALDLLSESAVEKPAE